MAPAKGNKPEDPWGWALGKDLVPENIGIQELLKAYRIHDFYPCEESRRNCKRNPFCVWGLGERKWVQGDEEGSGGEDDGFRSEGEFAGLQNLGATCYVNSLLQLWYHNPVIRPAILAWQPPGLSKDGEPYAPVGPVAQLQAMFARMKLSKKSKIDPTEFVTTLKLDTGEQQDAQEFSKLFMDCLLKMLSDKTDGAVKSAISNAFRGEIQYETECKRCKNKTQREETFNELELGVSKNLDDALGEFTKDELLSESNQYFCSNCDGKHDAIRRTKLLKLPPVLNLQLMRFVFDRETYRKKKVHTVIEFPEVLDMTDRIHKSPRNRQKERFIYHLSAVLIHNGSSASSGHYMAQIKNLRTGVWHKFNDETVDKVTKTVKSRKLVLKEDEEEESESEANSKAKPKNKGKVETHNSSGAYMLVYTLEKYESDRQPDPEVWPYLEQLVKTEDEAYEAEMKQSREDKESAAQYREQRKRQISALYPTLILNGKSDDENEDQEPPNKKIANSDTSNGGQGGRKINGTNGVSHEKGSLKKGKGPHENGHLKAKTKETFNNNLKPDINSLDFLHVEWFKQWLDIPNKVGESLAPNIETRLIECIHQKLRPPLPNITACEYRAVPTSFAEMVYKEYIVDGPTFHGAEALCRECVLAECIKLRKMEELDQDHKEFTDIIKSGEAILNGKKRKIEDESLDLCWVSKDVSKSWKKLAKRKVEIALQKDHPSLQITENGEEDNCEIIFPLPPPGPLNSDVLCIHGRLSINDSHRKLIPFKAWTVIDKYFEDAVHIPADKAETCTSCEEAKKGDEQVRNQQKEAGQKQKSLLPDLYSDKNRPDLCNGEIMYVVSQDFVSAWRKFARDATKADAPTTVNNAALLCTHEKFQYPLDYTADMIRELKVQGEMICLLRPDEWQILKEKFSVDLEITIQQNSEGELEYAPESCETCASAEWARLYNEQFKYENKFIHIVKRSKDDSLADSVVEVEDDLFLKVTKKRPRKCRDPTAWSIPNCVDSNSSTTASASLFRFGNDANTAVRRSGRPRREKIEKSYRVSSSDTLKSVKLKLVKDFTTFLSDIHLFFNDEELNFHEKTLEGLKIPPDATIYLEIDTPDKDAEDTTPIPPEVGFTGTILLGSTSSPSRDENDLNKESEEIPMDIENDGEDL